MVAGESELDTRRTIYILVSENPGLHLREIQRRLGSAVSLVEYHLRALEADGLAQAITQDGYQRWFSQAPSGQMALGGRDRRLLGIIRRPMPQSIILFLLAQKQAQQGEIARALQVSPSRLAYHLHKLVRSEVIFRVRRGPERGYSLIDPTGIHRLLLRHRRSLDIFDELAALFDDLDGL